MWYSTDRFVWYCIVICLQQATYDSISCGKKYQALGSVSTSTSHRRIDFSSVSILVGLSLLDLRITLITETKSQHGAKGKERPRKGQR